MFMKILIVEDDLIFAEGMKIMLQENMGYEVSGIAQEYNEALRLIKATQPDLLLLDIQIKGELNGVQLAEQVQKMGGEIPIIFITSLQSSEIFEQAKTTSPYAYLTKPVDVDTLQKTIELALHKYAFRHRAESTWTQDVAIQNSFFVKVGRRVQKVHIPTIHYLEVNRNYSHIVLDDQQLQVRMTFKELSQKLPQGQFLKINKSYIVNITKVENVDLEMNLVHVGNDQVPVSKRYRKELLQALGLS